MTFGETRTLSMQTRYGAMSLCPPSSRQWMTLGIQAIRIGTLGFLVSITPMSTSVTHGSPRGWIFYGFDGLAEMQVGEAALRLCVLIELGLCPAEMKTLSDSLIPRWSFGHVISYLIFVVNAHSICLDLHLLGTRTKKVTGNGTL